MNTHTDRQTYTQGLKNIRSTQLSTIKENAVSFLFPLLFTLFCLHLHRGSAVAVAVFGIFARLMEYTNLTTEQLRDAVCFFTSLGTLFFFQLAPRLFQNLPSSLKISQVACGERHTLFALEDGRVAACG